MKSIAFMAFFIPFLSPPAFSQEELKPELFVMCKHGSEVRTIAIQKTSTGFKTIYSKGGVPKVVGTGMAFQSNKGFAENIKNNLAKSGFECRDVGEASVAAPATEPTAQ